MQKDEIKKAFISAESSYDANAIVQRHMCERLWNLLVKRSLKTFNSIFEFGSGTGLFTKYLSMLDFKRYICNDIYDYAKKYSDHRINTEIFDIEHIREYSIFTYKFDLIASNACMQWLCFDRVINDLYEMLDSKGILLLSTFGEHNLKEVKNITSIGLRYKKLQDIKTTLSNRFSILELQEEIKTLDFSNALEVFRHLKKSGVNSLANTFLKRSWLKAYDRIYKGRLTYHCIYILARKL